MKQYNDIKAANPIPALIITLILSYFAVSYNLWCLFGKGFSFWHILILAAVLPSNFKLTLTIVFWIFAAAGMVFPVFPGIFR